MAHGPIHILSGPADARAHEGIPAQPRRRLLDVACPTCLARGQYNTELHPHGRSKREACPDCGGEGWLETSGDLTEVFDIVAVDGQAQWVTRYVAIDNQRLYAGALPVDEQG